jgi:hypothetical protein
LRLSNFSIACAKPSATSRVIIVIPSLSAIRCASSRPPSLCQAATWASRNNTSECNIRSCVRLVRLKLRLRALARHPEHRMGEFPR